MASRNAPSLLDMCITKTCSLLRDHHGCVDADEEIANPSSHPPSLTVNSCSLLRDSHRRLDENEEIANPFGQLPSHIVDQLLERALYMKMHGSSRVDMLRPLLMSGRVTEIEIPRHMVLDEDKIEVFRILFHYASGIRKVTATFTYFGDGLPDTDPIVIAFANFISKCSNLQHLSCSDNFYMDSIDRYPKLGFLEVTLKTMENLLPQQINESTKLCYNLTHVHLTDYCSPEAAVKLLQWCPNLISLENDIAEALEALHGKDYADGNLNKTYRLQKYILGTNGTKLLEEYADNLLQNDVAVRIATLTCPLTTDLRVWTCEYTSLAALTNFKNLDSLKVEWDFLSFGDDHPVLATTLQTIGNGLRTLHVHRFLEVDFAAIDRWCPNLEELSASYTHSQGKRKPSAGTFSKLRKLCLYCDGVKREDLLFLLSNCKDLRELDVSTVECLTDELLASIMRKNVFWNLEKAYFGQCSFNGDGFNMFFDGCPRLEQAIFDPSNFKNRENERIRREINLNLRFSKRQYGHVERLLR